jgi:Capsule polysaccharide biosynthesis protein
MVLRFARPPVDGMIWPWRRNRRNGPALHAVNPRQERSRVLIATSLGGYDHAQALDATLATALGLRGSDVRVLLCDAVLPACQMSKSPRVTAETLVSIGQTAYCATCFGRGSERFRRLPLVTYSQFLTSGDRATAARIADELPMDQIRGFRFRELGVGEHAYAGALRFFARGDLDGEPHGQAVLRRYLHAGLLTIMALDGLFEQHSVDVVVAHHGIYIPQGMIVEAARRRGIRVVTWNPAYRKHSFIFSHDDTYHHTMMSEPTRVWEDLPLIDEIRQHTLRYLDSRRAGTNDWIWFHDQPREDARRVLTEIGAHPDRPYLVLLTSVVWDAQLHYASNAFPTMLDWVRETILYFRRRPDLQLVIRVHPAEVRGLVPSRQRIADEVARWFPQLPANVFVIGPEHQASTYALTDHANAIAIYNTKTGVEVAAQGRPVIVAGEAWIRGKGFSLDVSTAEDYIQVLDRLPFSEGMSPTQIDRAIRYAYHFFFRRMIPLPFIAQRGPASFTVTATDTQLQPGTFRGLDVICDGILTGSPFVYPSESLADPLAERHEQAVS